MAMRHNGHRERDDDEDVGDDVGAEDMMQVELHPPMEPRRMRTQQQAPHGHMERDGGNSESKGTSSQVNPAWGCKAQAGENYEYSQVYEELKPDNSLPAQQTHEEEQYYEVAEFHWSRFVWRFIDGLTGIPRLVWYASHMWDAAPDRVSSMEEWYKSGVPSAALRFDHQESEFGGLWRGPAHFLLVWGQYCLFTNYLRQSELHFGAVALLCYLSLGTMVMLVMLDSMAQAFSSTRQDKMMGLEESPGLKRVYFAIQGSVIPRSADFKPKPDRLTMDAKMGARTECLADSGWEVLHDDVANMFSHAQGRKRHVTRHVMVAAVTIGSAAALLSTNYNLDQDNVKRVDNKSQLRLTLTLGTFFFVVMVGSLLDFLHRRINDYQSQGNVYKLLGIEMEFMDGDNRVIGLMSNRHNDMSCWRPLQEICQCVFSSELPDHIFQPKYAAIDSTLEGACDMFTRLKSWKARRTTLLKTVYRRQALMNVAMSAVAGALGALVLVVIYYLVLSPYRLDLLFVGGCGFSAIILLGYLVVIFVHASAANDYRREHAPHAFALQERLLLRRLNCTLPLNSDCARNATGQSNSLPDQDSREAVANAFAGVADYAGSLGNELRARHDLNKVFGTEIQSDVSFRIGAFVAAIIFAFFERAARDQEAT